MTTMNENMKWMKQRHFIVDCFSKPQGPPFCTSTLTLKYPFEMYTRENNTSLLCILYMYANALK